jgi:hypothetical protein
MSGSDGPARFKATIKKQGNTVTVTGGPTR